jgi:His/Glu/Gln/Arg/opine family amino acid ABC transporter permease subunit
MFDVFLWSILRKYTSVFLLGFKNTFWICFVSIALALIVGILVGLAKLSRFPLVSRPVSAYVAFIRSTPLLVQIYIIFFGLPHLGITIPTIQAGILALVLNSGAYIAEIVRAGILSIPKGQTEAAQAIGMTGLQINRFIILPQALRNVIPPLLGQFTYLIKDTSLLSAIGIHELIRAANVVNSRAFRPVEAFAPIFLSYLLINLILLSLAKMVDRYTTGGEAKWR